MEISQRDKIALQKITTDGSFEVMKTVADELLATWSNGSVIKETEFGTIKETISREERRNALVIFLQTLEKLAHD